MGKGEKHSSEQAFMGQSHYFQTLADPFNVHGEKIPDDNTTPSSTLTITDRQVLTLSAGGLAALCYGIAGGNSALAYGAMVPHIQILSFSSDGKTSQKVTQADIKKIDTSVKKKMLKTGDEPVDINPNDPNIVWIDNSDGHLTLKDGTIPKAYSEAAYIVGTKTLPGGAASTVDLFPPTVGTDQAPFTFTEWVADVGVPTLYQKARLVSAGISIDYLGSALNAKGRMTLASVPRRTLRSSMQGGDLTLVMIQNLVGAKIIPINKLKTGSLTYRPLDEMDRMYTDLTAEYDCTSMVFHDDDMSLGNEFFVVIDGAEGSATCQITAVFNYEAIPKLGTLNLVQPTYSRNDPIELSMVSNAIEKVPTVHAGGGRATQALESGKTQIPEISAPESSKLHATEEQREEGEEESFMNKILGAATPLMAKAPGPLGMIGKAMPLAKQALGFLGL